MLIPPLLTSPERWGIPVGCCCRLVPTRVGYGIAAIAPGTPASVSSANPAPASGCLLWMTFFRPLAPGGSQFQARNQLLVALQGLLNPVALQYSLAALFAQPGPLGWVTQEV